MKLTPKEVTIYIKKDLNLTTNQINQCEQNIIKLLELLNWLLNENILVILSSSKIENEFWQICLQA